MRVHRRTATAALAVIGLTTATLGPAGLMASAAPTPPEPPTATPAPKNPTQASQKIRKQVRPENIEAHLRAFQEIADKNNGNRAVGTSGYEHSARYVEAVLRKAGYRTQRQHFEYTHDEVKSSKLTVAGKAVAHQVLSYSPAAKEGFTGQLVQPKVMTGCDAAAWSGINAKDKIAVVQRGGCSFSDKSSAAGAAGAAALIVYNNGDGELNGTLGKVDQTHIPTITVTKAVGADLIKETGPQVEATLVLDKLTEKRRTFNILAETKAGRADNVALVGAHLDSVPQGPGINDNASGSASILEVAVQMAKQKGITNKVRFAWWGAEEIGLLGSTHYVEDMKKKDPESLKKIAAYLNFDMVGSPNYSIGVYDADQSTHEAPVNVPEGSIQTESIFTDYFDSVGQPWIDSEFNGRSDYQAFIENGIPASGIDTGADGKKSKGEVLMFGGVEGAPYDGNYHTPKDSMTNVNMHAVDVISDAIAHTVFTMANSTKDINGR
ncbi:Aminopeptidase S [Dermatophilus congolensis]|uniref:Aminopeptidase S n=1 Tax=Dermatophilus congolensis TaxID=1863 RepID=A0AA46BQ12_9MICO|nr:M20/M25/M40 family metallo-hydrolase [Dermatophilus congolensis]STD14610.1 Aminopeptidase S [Dermatophilus congolensis]